MIKVSVMYPNSKQATFDLNYYQNTHMPLVQKLVGDAVKEVAIDSGVAGGMPGTDAPFVAIGHMLFDSIESFQQSFTPHAQEILADIPNYTNTQPQVQISQIIG